MVLRLWQIATPVRLGQWDRRRDPRLIADDAGRVALAGQILGQIDVARPVAVDAAVARGYEKGRHVSASLSAPPLEDLAAGQAVADAQHGLDAALAARRQRQLLADVADVRLE